VNADGQTLRTKLSPAETRRNIATFGGVLAGHIHRGGLRARILTEGLIRVGDVIRPGRPEPGRAVTGRPWMS
jgi:hypothetical protein